MKRLGFWVCVLYSAAIFADAQTFDDLPNPLTLEAALALIDSSHADVLLAQSNLHLSQANLLEAQQANKMALNVTLEKRRIGPSAYSSFQQKNDSRASLYLRQRLLDFGQTSSRVDATRQNIQSERALLLSARQDKHLEIMRRFFAVIMADLTEQKESEAMSVAFIRYDKLNDRYQLGMISHLPVLAAQSAYEQVRIQYTQSGLRQRATRLDLSLSLNQGRQLPADVTMPDFDGNLLKQVMDIDMMTHRALDNSPSLHAEKLDLMAAQSELMAAQAKGRPVVYAEASLHGYQRKTGGTPDWQMGLVLEMPILDGGKKKMAVAKSHALVIRQTAIVQQQENKIRQQVMDLWLSYQRLVQEVKALQVEGEYQELLMDKSRALYDLEVNADFGEAMVRLSDYELKKATAEFSLMLVDAEIKAIEGQLFSEDTP